MTLRELKQEVDGLLATRPALAENEVWVRDRDSVPLAEVLARIDKKRREEELPNIVNVAASMEAEDAGLEDDVPAVVLYTE